MASSGSDITQFFAGRSIFLTGVTGFVGKAVLEKLLRSCPDISSVFVLIREVKGKTYEQRLMAVFQSPLFDRLRKERPTIFSKVKAVRGDITASGLGLDSSDQIDINEKVSVAIHAAASVKFNDPLKSLIRTNLEGTIHVIEMAVKMERLQAFVYVSTAYSNCNKKDVMELVYQTQVTPKMVVEATAGMTESQATAYVHSLMEGRPNYYTYTKSLAEQVVSSYKETLPVCIVRPSIVSATLAEPVSGWVDNYNGGTGLLVAILHGFLRCLYIASRYSAPDLIPLDFVVNLIIAAAWHTASTSGRPRETVFNCCSRGSNPVTLENLFFTSRRAAYYFPFRNVIWYPSMLPLPWKALWPVANFIFHRIPYQIMDSWAKFKGEKPRLMSLYRRTASMVNSIDFFLNSEFRLSTRNTSYLYDLLGDEDKRKFNFNTDSIIWEPYIYNYVDGIKRFVLGETTDDITDARARLTRLYYLHQVAKGLAFMLPVLLLVLIFRWTGTPCQLMEGICQLWRNMG